MTVSQTTLCEQHKDASMICYHCHQEQLDRLQEQVTRLRNFIDVVRMNPWVFTTELYYHAGRVLDETASK